MEKVTNKGIKVIYLEQVIKQEYISNGRIY